MSRRPFVTTSRGKYSLIFWWSKLNSFSSIAVWKYLRVKSRADHTERSVKPGFYHTHLRSELEHARTTLIHRLRFEWHVVNSNRL